MTTEELEAEFLALIRSFDPGDQARMRKLVAGVLAGRVTLTLDEAQRLRAGDVIALADALPDDCLTDWPGTERAN